MFWLWKWNGAVALHCSLTGASAQKTMFTHEINFFFLFLFFPPCNCFLINFPARLMHALCLISSDTLKATLPAFRHFTTEFKRERTTTHLHLLYFYSCFVLNVNGLTLLSNSSFWCFLFLIQLYCNCLWVLGFFGVGGVICKECFSPLCQNTTKIN